MALFLEKKRYCPSFKTYEEQILPRHAKYDHDLWKLLLAEYEEPSVVELKARRGREIISNLPVQFKAENHGRFIAVTFTGKILGVRNTLGALNEELAEKEIKENYYVERLGYGTIAQI